MNLNAVTTRVTKDEAARLKAYAVAQGRTQSDVMREFIRSLPAPRAARTASSKRRAAG